MDHANGSINHGKRPLMEACEELPLVVPEAKKQRKNPSQIQILEDAYAVESNPSASMKEELVTRTGLDYKKVQYWFGNRRYLDRHGPRRYAPRRNGDAPDMSMALIAAPNAKLPMIGSIGNAESSLSWCNSQLQMHGAAHSLLQGTIPEMPMPLAAMLPQPLTQNDLYFTILAHAEKTLGHPLRSDGPVLGIEFMPLPPGAFGTNLASTGDVMTSSKVPDNSRNIHGPSPELAQMPSLRSHIMNNIEHFGQTSMPTTVIYKKECTSAGPSTEENGCSTQKIGEKTKDNCDQGKGYKLPLVSGHGQFFVRPRIGSSSRRAILDDSTGMGYFADTTVATVIAEWHENERKVVYSVDHSEICLSDTSAGDLCRCNKLKCVDEDDDVEDDEVTEDWNYKADDGGDNC